MQGLKRRLRADGPRDRGAELERVVGCGERDAGQRRFTRGAFRVEAPEGLGARKIAEPRRALRAAAAADGRQDAGEAWRLRGAVAAHAGRNLVVHRPVQPAIDAEVRLRVRGGRRVDP